MVPNTILNYTLCKLYTMLLNYDAHLLKTTSAVAVLLVHASCLKKLTWNDLCSLSSSQTPSPNSNIVYWIIFTRINLQCARCLQLSTVDVSANVFSKFCRHYNKLLIVCKEFNLQLIQYRWPCMLDHLLCSCDVVWGFYVRAAVGRAGIFGAEFWPY